MGVCTYCKFLALPALQQKKLYDVHSLEAFYPLKSDSDHWKTTIFLSIIRSLKRSVYSSSCAQET